MPRKALITLTLLVSTILAGCHSKQEPVTKEAAPIPVIVATPTVKDVTVYLESIGTLQPSVFMEIRPQTSGTLIDVLIAEGQTVKQGDPLFKIDPQPYQIKVLEAKAQFAIDQAQLEAVQKKIARYEDLADRDLIAQTEWDELKAQLQKAQASIDFDRARLNYSKLELKRCILESPIDGRLGKLDASQGVLVTHGQPIPLVTIAKMDPLIVEFSVTEKEFPLLPKERIQVSIQSLGSQTSEATHKGQVTFLDNHFDAKTGLLLIRGRVDNADYSLRPGQSVRVQIPIALTSHATLIPQKAIRYNQQGPYVYTVHEDMTVNIRQLILGKEYETDQMVLEGLDPSETIILDGHLRLSPGLKVEIKS